jgi:PAS domain S-box-containing protein
MENSQSQIRILFIEDLPSDYELAKSLLKREGVEFTDIRVENAEDMKREIKSFRPHIFISDYSMPNFDGIKALRIAQELAPDTPFVLLTGSINEETAVECMKSGANDYVLKERMTRLPYAVKEALEQAKAKVSKRKAERALVRSEERFRNLAENAQDFIFRLDYEPSIKFSYASPSSLKITGHSPEEFYQHPNLSTSIIHPDDIHLFKNLRQSKTEKFRLTYRLVRKDKQVIYIEQINFFVRDDAGKAIALEAIARDVTDRKLAELALAESEAQYRLLFESNPNPMWVYDSTTLKFLAVNDVAVKNYGYSKDDFLRMTIKDIRPEEQLPRLQENVFKVTDEIQHSGPWIHSYKNGKTIFVEITSHSIQYYGKDARLVVAYNVTDRVEATQKLYEQKKVAQATLDSISANICLVNNKGDIVSVNKQWLDFAKENNGDPGKTGIGANYFKVCQMATGADAETADTILKGMETILSGKNNIFESEYELVSISEKKWYQIRVVPFLENDLYRNGLVISHIDITSKKLAELELLASEQRYRIFMNSTNDIAFLKDKELRYIMINEKGLQFFNKYENEVLGLTDFDLSPSSIANISNKSDLQAIANGDIVINTLPFDKKIYETRKFPVRLIDGGVGVGGFIRDVTDWYLAKQKIEESEKKYKSLVENSLVGVYATNFEGVFQFANQAMCNIFEFDSLIDLMNCNIKKLYKEPQLREEFIRILKSQHILNNCEVEFLTPNGNTKHLIVSASLVGSNISGMMMDITDRKNAEMELVQKKMEIEAQNEEYRTLNEELFEAKEKAEENDRLKTAFLQNLSHEIRTPMNGIVGFTQLLKEKKDDPEITEQYLEMIEKSGDRLMNLISDLVDISKIETGQITFSQEEFNINNLFHDLNNHFSKEAEEKGIALTIGKKPDDINSIIVSDKHKIFQILSNLLSNAIKFSDQGTVEFGCQILDNYFEFYVTDQGIGIPPDKVESVFQPFRQGDTSISRGYEGAGLGLSISKAYVEKLGGTIWVESIPGKGSTFKFSIPCD